MKICPFLALHKNIPSYSIICLEKRINPHEWLRRVGFALLSIKSKLKWFEGTDWTGFPLILYVLFFYEKDKQKEMPVIYHMRNLIGNQNGHHTYFESPVQYSRVYVIYYIVNYIHFKLKVFSPPCQLVQVNGSLQFFYIIRQFLTTIFGI